MNTVSALDAAFQSKVPLVDLRSESEFEALHLQHATNLPLCDLRERDFELPARVSSSYTTHV